MDMKNKGKFSFLKDFMDRVFYGCEGMPIIIEVPINDLPAEIRIKISDIDFMRNSFARVEFDNKDGSLKKILLFNKNR